MTYKLKKIIGKRAISFLLVLSIVLPGFYLPNAAPKAHAFLGFGDINFEIGSHVRSIVDAIAMAMAQQMVDRMVQSTVKWAQDGFEGNPAYVTDPKQYFGEIADGVAGEYIAGTDLGFLCSPFQAQIRLALLKNYNEPLPFQCTLTGTVQNIEAFYGDFSQGGWDGWFSMTQNEANNPYGAFLSAKIELDSRLANAIGLENKNLDRNQGFISWSDCEVKNPPAFLKQGDPGWDPNYGAELQPNPDHVPGKAEGECIKRGPTKTPGTTIKAQLDKVLPSGMERLISAQHIEQLVSSFATGLLNRYVFGSKGLFASNSTKKPPTPGGTGESNVGGTRGGMIDLDSDGIPEGQDFDYDLKLTSSTDVCFHGKVPPNCTLSTTVTSSPYFTPVCEAVDGAVSVLTEYTKFLDSHADQMEDGGKLKGVIISAVLLGPVGAIFGGFFGHNVDNFKNKADADIWANRTSEANSSVDEVLSKIRDRRSSYFDDMEIVTNRFANYIGKVMESLIKDKDLDLARNGNGGGGLENLMKHTAYNLRYFMEVKTKIGKCENPNAGPVEDIPLPPDVPPPDGGGGGGGSGGSCQLVTRAGVEAIVKKYQPNDAGIQQALPELRTSFGSQVTVYGTTATDFIDKINFGGGLTVDVISNAGTNNAAWTWQVLTQCGDGGGEGDGTIPASLRSGMEAERGKISASFITQAQAGVILNAVAWNNRDSGWGLSKKTGGNRCPMPSGGVEIACDVLYHQPSQTVWDVFTSSDNTGFSTNNYEGRVTWSRVQTYDFAGRPWVAPVQP